MQQPTYQRPVYEHRIIQCKQVKVKVPPRVEAHRAALIVSVALSQTRDKSARPWIWG